MEQQQERLVKGIWIPIEIWKDKNLTWNEKILFLEIDSYTSKENDCFFSNEYISELLGISETNANKTLSSLIKKGYVIKTKFDGRHRYIKTALSYSTTLPCQEQQASHARMIEYTSIQSNNNLINKDNKEKEIDKSISKKGNKFALDMSLVDETFMPIVLEWLEYKKEKRQSYKQRGFNAMYESLLKMSNNNPSVAKAIVEQSMQNNYAGLFPLKNNTRFDNLPTGMIIRETLEERNEKLKNENGW